MEDRSVFVSFKVDAGFAPDRSYRELRIDERVTPIHATVRIVEDEADPGDAQDAAKVEMQLIRCGGSPGLIFDAEDMMPLWRALFEEGDSIPTEIKWQFGVKSNDVLLLNDIAVYQAMTVDEWLPNVLARFRQMFGFHGAVVAEKETIGQFAVDHCGFEPLKPVRHGKVWRYYVLNYRAK